MPPAAWQRPEHSWHSDDGWAAGEAGELSPHCAQCGDHGRSLLFPRVLASTILELKPRQVRAGGMQLSPERRVPPAEHLETRVQRLVTDWETIRAFLEVVRCGSFRSASEKTGQSVNA